MSGQNDVESSGICFGGIGEPLLQERVKPGTKCGWMRGASQPSVRRYKWCKMRKPTVQRYKWWKWRNSTKTMRRRRRGDNSQRFAKTFSSRGRCNVRLRVRRRVVSPPLPPPPCAAPRSVSGKRERERERGVATAAAATAAVATARSLARSSGVLFFCSCVTTRVVEAARRGEEKGRSTIPGIGACHKNRERGGGGG